MIDIGPHVALAVSREQTEVTRAFYADVLGARVDQRPGLDLYAFPGGFTVDVFFVDPAEALDAAALLKGAYLELRTDDVAAAQKRIMDFGLAEVPGGEPGAFLFQAPGGQVFRVCAATKMGSDPIINGV